MTDPLSQTQAALADPTRRTMLMRLSQGVATVTDLGDGTTRLSIAWVPLNATEVKVATFDGARAGMQGGWEHQFGPIEGYLARL